MNLPTLSPIKNIVLLIVISITCVALAGCGNKGPLVRPSEIPVTASAPAAAPTDGEPAAEPDVTPAAETASGAPAAQR